MTANLALQIGRLLFHRYFSKKLFEPRESLGPQARTNHAASFFCAAEEASKWLDFSTAKSFLVTFLDAKK
jgi:hypothetical protein